MKFFEDWSDSFLKFDESSVLLSIIAVIHVYEILSRMSYKNTTTTI